MGKELPLQANPKGGLINESVLNQEGESKSVEVHFADGLALIQTAFSNSDIHLSSPANGAQVVSYFKSIFGIYQPIAPFKGYQSFALDFFIADAGDDVKSMPIPNTYRISCQMH